MLTYAEAEVSRLMASGQATAADLCFSLQVGVWWAGDPALAAPSQHWLRCLNT